MITFFKFLTEAKLLNISVYVFNEDEKIVYWYFFVTNNTIYHNSTYVLKLTQILYMI